MIGAQHTWKPSFFPFTQGSAPPIVLVTNTQDIHWATQAPYNLSHPPQTTLSSTHHAPGLFLDLAHFLSSGNYPSTYILILAFACMTIIT